MKLIDKFLKFLKTDRNTFFTYILTCITIYLSVDRLIEIMFMILTGVSLDYWGPIKYTLALACPIFAFLFSGSSKFVNGENSKITFFNMYCIFLYIIFISMIVQWINLIAWLLFTALPCYINIVTNFSNLVAPAFKALALYLPLTTIYPLFKWMYAKINDNKDIKDSIKDYGGIDLSKKPENLGPYTCEMPLFADKGSGTVVKILENNRFQPTFICGVSGSGKTSMMFEPMMAKDLEKKAFYKNASKTLGYAALKSGLATLKYPYDNKYLNENFNLNMLVPNPDKEKTLKLFLRKMIYCDTPNIVFRNIGFTSMSPDYESTSRILEVAKNYNIPVNLIDPLNINSPGLNPFAFDDPIRIALIISSVLKEMYLYSGRDIEESFKQNVTLQAVENLTILLKEMYPKLNNGDLPSLEDMLNMFNDFSLVEDMCKKMELDSNLAEKYKIQIGYFKNNFYSTGSNRTETEKCLHSATSQLDTLLRVEGVKNILCNRTNNLDYDKILANGEITLLCTRRGDLGATVHTAFGLFFLLLMQYSVLRRPGNEKTRIPHFLYIDEFPDFITHATTNMFTLYRKYKVGIIISAQNLRQLGEQQKSKYRETILANCSNKFIFGNNTPEDNSWWELELGQKREWTFNYDFDTEKTAYDPKWKNAQYKWKSNYAAGKVQSLKDKQCIYKIKNSKGKTIVGVMRVNFLDSKYSEPHISKNYNFSKFTNGILNDDKAEKNKNKKFDLKNITFDKSENGEIDPIKNNTSDLNFLFDNEDAVIFNLNKKKKNKE